MFDHHCTACDKRQLIFPSQSFTKNCTIQPSPTGEEEQNLNRAFNAVLNG